MSILATLISERADVDLALPPALVWLVVGMGLVLAGLACRALLEPWVIRFVRSVRRRYRLDGPSHAQPSEAQALLVRNMLSLQEEAVRLQAQLAVHADPLQCAELEVFQSSLEHLDQRIDGLGNG